MSRSISDDHHDQSVLIVMTSGPSTPQRCATPFYIGSLLAAMDAEVSIFFTMEGVQLAREGVAAQLVAMAGGKTILEFMRDAKRAGVRLHLCKPAMPGYDLAEDEVIAEIDEIGNASALADKILSCDKTLFF